MYWKIGVYNFCITSSPSYFSVYYIKVFQSLLLIAISFVASILASLKYFLSKQRTCPETDHFFSAGFRYTILSCNIIYRNNQISILIWCSLSYTVGESSCATRFCMPSTKNITPHLLFPFHICISVFLNRVAFKCVHNTN